MRRIGRQDRVTQPWKNGGGITHELWREDRGSGFALRLSIAEVERDGPFSRFPGIDRVILMLEGNGFRLRSGDRLVEIARPHEPFAFAGEDDWHCTLVDGPVRDFNVMVDRAVYTARVTREQGRIDLGARGFALLDGYDLLAGAGEVELDEPAIVVRITGR